MIKMKDITGGLSKEKRRSDSLWCQIFIRPLSFIVSWVFVNIGVTAFQVSALAIVFPIAAFALFICSNPFTAILLLNIWLILDCVDGNIARVQGPSRMGGFVDAVSGYFMFGLSFFGAGLYLTIADGSSIAWIWSMLGGLASVFSLLSRILFQKYRFMSEEDSVKLKTSGSSVLLVLDKNIGISGFLTPLMLIAYLTEHLTYFLIFYSVYSICLAIGVTVYLLKKSR